MESVWMETYVNVIKIIKEMNVVFQCVKIIVILEVFAKKKAVFFLAVTMFVNVIKVIKEILVIFPIVKIIVKIEVNA